MTGEYRKRDEYQREHKRLRDRVTRPWDFGVSKETAEKYLAKFEADTECTGLIGDPNHQGAHCTCRY